MSSRRNHGQSTTGRRKGDKHLVCKESRPRDPPQLLDRNLPHDQEIDEYHPHPEPFDAGFLDNFSRLILNKNMPMGAEMETAMALNVAYPTSAFPPYLTQQIELSSQHDVSFPGDAAAALTPSAPHSAATFPSYTTVVDGQTAAAHDVEYARARAIAKKFKDSRERKDYVFSCIRENTAGLLPSHRGVDVSPSTEAGPCSHFLGSIDEAFPIEEKDWVKLSVYPSMEDFENDCLQTIDGFVIVQSPSSPSE